MGLALVFFTSIFLSAQEKKDKREILDEVVVSATKFKLKKENTGKIIYKITQEDLEKNAGRSVVEVLNNVPGIEIRGTNSVSGEPRSTYIRGGRSRQVLVLIDGVPVSDPTGIEQSYDLRLLSLNQIESIEILKGSSSTLYGTGAGTGVINIILKKGSKSEVSGTYEMSLGTNRTAKNARSGLRDRNQNVSIAGTQGNVEYNAYLNATGIDGISAAKSQSNTVFQDDSYSAKNAFLKLAYNINKQFKVESFFNYDQFDYDYDGGAFFDSNVNNGSQEQLRVGFRPSYKYNKGEVYALVSFNDIDRFFESPNFFSGALEPSIYNGRSLNVDFVNKYEFNKNFQIITGFNYQDHSNETNTPFSSINRDLASFNTFDPYVSFVYITDFGLSVNAGSRLNVHSNYGNHFVYDGNLAYGLIKNEDLNIKLMSSYSTAFIVPSLYQLFSAFGNQDLKPETNRTFEFGFESWLGDKFQLNAVYFDRAEEDKVIFGTVGYENALTTINANGVEADATYYLSDKAKLNLAYTYVNKDDDTFYIPKSKLFASIEFKPFKNTFLSAVFRNVGDRDLFDFESNTIVTLPSYSLFDLNTNHKVLNGKVTFFGAVTNLFNEDYEETFGFNTRGRNFKLGLRLKF